MQSVEHMPQKVLFYRFLNTIIDDLFSFVIVMPTMHRISCFRDDFIFVIYLYQRYYYRIDKTRGFYGVRPKPEANEVKAEEAKSTITPGQPEKDENDMKGSKPTNRKRMQKES